MPVATVWEEGAFTVRMHVQMIAFLEKVSTKKSDLSDRSDNKEPPDPISPEPRDASLKKDTESFFREWLDASQWRTP
jgi:hypothetical protein